MYIATTFRSWNIKINNMALAKTILFSNFPKVNDNKDYRDFYH